MFPNSGGGQFIFKSQYLYTNDKSFSFCFFISLIAIQIPGKSIGRNSSHLKYRRGSAKINSSFFVDWSIGESTVIDTYYGENAYSNLIVGKKWNVTSGILQPYDKNHIIFNALVPHWTLQEIRLYPVPTSDVIYIDFRSTTTGKESIQLMTLSGKLLALKEFTQIGGCLLPLYWK
jgi:hypothetical protein